jgi:filamentous hemagglutinin family protein
MNPGINGFIYFLSPTLWLIFLPLAAFGQVTSDGATASIVTGTDNQNFTVTGGTQAGENLFHSFENFSVPSNGSVVFQSDPTTTNILSRITGNTASVIEGLLEIQGSDANFFLLNPHGIVFGSRARLSLGGSFLATTAEQIDFSDGVAFRTTDPKPLLSVNIPTGLKFGSQPGDIVNRSSVQDSSGFPVGLQVSPAKTLALIGGNVSIEGGGLRAGGALTLLAPGGRIEIGSVAGNSTVALTVTHSDLVPAYSNVQNFQDIQLSAGSFLNVTGASSGTVNLQGRNIEFKERSQVGGGNFGANAGGLITLNGSELVQLQGESAIGAPTFFTGSAGNVVINTKKLVLSNDSIIDATTVRAGHGGNIEVNASDQVEISGLSSLTAETFRTGNAGTVKILTQRLVLSNGGRIRTASRGSGNGGKIEIQATDSVTVQGRQARRLEVAPLFENPIVPSGILAVTENPLTPVTRELSTGNGGTIEIKTDRLNLIDGGIISVQNAGTGRAGDIELQGNELLLNDGAITATTRSGNGGNINIDFSRLLQFRNSSEISSMAGNGQFGGDGGNIIIETPFIVAFPSRPLNLISTNAFTGNGGNINITTNNILGDQFLRITASSQFGLSGTVLINRRVPNLTEVSNLPTEILDPELIQGCAADRESHFINVGRGGAITSPYELLSSAVVLEDLQLPQQWQSRRESRNLTNKSNFAAIVEAQGWQQDAAGNIKLVADASFTHC